MPVLEYELTGAPGRLCVLPRRSDADGDDDAAAAIVREGRTYLYRVIDAASAVEDIEPRELFEPDDDNPAQGRFKPSSCVGVLGLRIRFADGQVGEAEVEVQSTKLGYETSYHKMLEQIAEQAAEAVLHGFAPASRPVHVDPSRLAELRYVSFAFLLARFRQPAFQAAVQLIRARPDRSWVAETEDRDISRGVPAGPHLARTLQRGGPRVRRPSRLRSIPVDHVPRIVPVDREESTYDTPANRFVRFAFTRWQGLALDVQADMEKRKDKVPGPRRRGRAEAAWAVAHCAEVLKVPALREAGELDRFPVGNQVLLRQPGYREVLRMFALTEATITLDALLPEDPFSATVRNVATLYEYWCFIALVRAISTIGGSAAKGVLFEPSADGLRLVLRRGEASHLTWELPVDGRLLLVELWFNRTFNPGPDAEPETGVSWSRRLIPDASIRIRPRSGRPGDLQDPELDVWLHFDAKYSIESIAAGAPLTEGPLATAAAQVRREHILKMHAYRDAIRRSAGAYVLYPGAGSQQLLSEYHEILPGLGAFALRPGEDGNIDGGDGLVVFIRQVLSHVANQASARERVGYWSAVSHRAPGGQGPPVNFLAKPPADTPVMVGYVREPQLDWVLENRLYNVRAGTRGGAVVVDDEILQARYVVLWGGSADEPPTIHGVFRRTTPWHLATADELAAWDYPVRAKSVIYFVTEIEPLPPTIAALVSPATIESTRPTPYGAPYPLPWSTLTAACPATGRPERPGTAPQ